VFICVNLWQKLDVMRQAEARIAKAADADEFTHPTRPAQAGEAKPQNTKEAS
jgi:hypothetical protein